MAKNNSTETGKALNDQPSGDEATSPNETVGTHSAEEVAAFETRMAELAAKEQELEAKEKELENRERELETKPQSNNAPSVPVDAVVSYKSGDTVTVALNYPHDLKYRLSGGREITFNGNATAVRLKGKGELPRGAYGLTLNVPAEDWEEVKKLYGGTAKFKQNLIFAQTDKHAAMDEAEEKAETRHDLEPVDTATTVTEPKTEGEGKTGSKKTKK